MLFGSECKELVEAFGRRNYYCRCHTFIEDFNYFNYIEYLCKLPFLPINYKIILLCELVPATKLTYIEANLLAF